MGMDEDAITLRRWQAQIEGRLTALEGHSPSIAPAASDVPAPSQDLADVRSAIEYLHAQIVMVGARLDAVEAKADEAVKVLTDVEIALGSHAHPPSTPTPEAPPAPVEPPQAEPQAHPEAPPDHEPPPPDHEPPPPDHEPASPNG